MKYRACKKCKGKLDPYAFIGVDWANEKDKTVVTVVIPPGEKNEKFSGMGRTGSR